MFKFLLAATASIALADRANPELFGKTAKLRESMETVKVALGESGFGSSIRDGRMTAEAEVPNNGIYVVASGHTSPAECAEKTDPVVLVGSYFEFNSGCNSNSTQGTSMFVSCNGTHLTGNMYLSLDCSGPIMGTLIFDVEAQGPQNCPSEGDGLNVYLSTLSCQVGPDSLKGTGNGVTEYSRYGDVCSENCLNAVDYVIYYGDKCLEVEVNGLSTSAKMVGCTEVDTNITVTYDVYTDGTCSQLVDSVDQVYGTTECEIRSEDGAVTATTLSCQSSVPDQCGSATRVGVAASVVAVIASVVLSMF